MKNSYIYTFENINITHTKSFQLMTSLMEYSSEKTAVICQNTHNENHLYEHPRNKHIPSFSKRGFSKTHPLTLQ